MEDVRKMPLIYQSLGLDTGRSRPVAIELNLREWRNQVIECIMMNIVCKEALKVRNVKVKTAASKPLEPRRPTS
jgi:hypothetical protein